MKSKILIALSIITLVSCQSNDKLKEKVTQLSAKVDSLEKTNNKSYTPGLGILMNAIQQHHLKMWKSALAQNWVLAGYELHEMEERFEEVDEYHSAGSEVKHLKMIYPQIEKLGKVIDEKNISEFNSKYETLTATCNACHQLNDRTFIKIAVPNKDYENQIFTP